MFFEGALKPSVGMLRPDSSRPGFGLECKLPDMESTGCMATLLHEEQIRWARPRAAEYPSSEAKALEGELRKRIGGEVRFDDGSRALYATDASNYRQVPIGVVVPKTVEDVLVTVEQCRRYGAPLLARGGGTSLAGQCCNVAIVLDFTST